jgi:hypothetical protein
LNEGTIRAVKGDRPELGRSKAAASSLKSCESAAEKELLNVAISVSER